jgi:hypothetical protein
MRSIPARVVARLSQAVTVTFAVAAIATLTLSFSPPLSAATPTPPPLTVGQEVFTTNKTNVRATADGTQPRYAVGATTAGPVTVSGNSVLWYKVAFNSGPSGWVGADMLIDGVPLPPTTNIGTPGGLNSMVLDEYGDIELVYSTGFDSASSNNNVTYSFRESTNQGLSFSTPSPLPVKQTATFQPFIPHRRSPPNATAPSISSIPARPASARPSLASRPSIWFAPSTTAPPFPHRS